MSPYNAYSSTLSSSYSPSNSKYSSTTYASSPTLSRYKPPAYSSSSSSRYTSRTKFESPSTYIPSIYSSSTYSPSTYTPSTYSSSTYTPSTISRQLSSTHISNRVPKFTSISSYTSAITNSNDWKWISSSSTSSTDSGSERLLRSPYLSSSRRNSSSSSAALSTLPRIQDRGSRSFSTYSSLVDEPCSKVNSSHLKSSLDNEILSTISTGLYNLGNTCFMNSILQCLIHTEPLIEYCTKGNYINDLNPKSPSNGNLISAFADFTKLIVETKSKAPVRPYRLRKEIQNWSPRFSGDNQQDAQEFLRCLLLGLHDDLNRVQYKPSRRNSSRCDSFCSWRLYKDTDDSLIVDLFAGLLKSTLKCTLCSNESITFDPFWDLSLPVPEGSIKASLKECYSMFTSPEFLDGSDKPMCDRCQKKTRASKQIEINIFPKTLVIHLKRFSSTRNGQKLNTMIDCPLKLTSVTDLSSHNCFGDRCTYTLYGVVDHDGTKRSGHYIAKCRSRLSNEWYEFNDTRITKATNVVTKNSYILFYSQE